MSYTLSEYESKRLLADAGVSVPDERLVDSADAAVAAAAEIGGAVVLKLCGRGIAHKSERNLVRLGLEGEASIRTAADQLLALRAPAESDAALLVQQMAGGRREVIAGLVRDEQFGPCVMFGLGGVFAEALHDVSFAVAPLAPGDAMDLIDSLQYRSVLGEFRGEPAANMASLDQVLEALGRIGDERPEVASIDINPMILSGAEPIIVDALVEMRDDA